jgi:phage host-nuclease inhibitor protein Gam
MQVEVSANAKIDAIRAEYDEKVEPIKQQIATVSGEIRTLRNEIAATMETLGVQTAGNDLIQVQRPSSTKWVIENLDTALAHIADLGKLNEVQSVVTNEASVKKLAEFVGGIDGVTKVTERGFKVVPVKSKAKQ